MNGNVMFWNLPDHISNRLINEYNEIHHQFVLNKWTPSELHGGRFCEVVYCVLEGYHSERYPREIRKPKSFRSPCKSQKHCKRCPRSFKVLIPQLLPLLYEFRNHRDVGHVGGDVDANRMDSTMVISTVNWIMCELIRVLHRISTDGAQQMVDSLTERRTPLVWDVDERSKTVLDTSMNVRQQIILLLHTHNDPITEDQLYSWVDYQNRSRFNSIVEDLRKQKLVFYHIEDDVLRITPVGNQCAEKLIKSRWKLKDVILS